MHMQVADRTALPWHGRAAMDVLLVFVMDIFTGQCEPHWLSRVWLY